MNNAQHGFTNNRSTITHFFITEIHLAEVVNSREYMDVISFDFSRAFDRVPHNKLLAVLSNRGVSSRALEWIQSFLTGRIQRVQYEGLSTQAAFIFGVIKGSCLGPILWTIFMDSLLSEIDILSVAFADDFKLLASMVRHSHSTVQENIDRIYAWSQRMRMPLSISKCLVTHYGVDNHHFQYDCGTSILPDSDTFVDFGVRRSANGFFHDHIAMVAQKGRRLVGMCFRQLQNRQPDFLLKVYKTYILPPIMYASQLWFPNLRYEVNKLDAVQCRLTKRIVGSSRDKSYGDRLQRCNLLSLESRKIERDMHTVFKLIHGLHSIILEDAALSLYNSITRGSGVRLKQP